MCRTLILLCLLAFLSAAPDRASTAKSDQESASGEQASGYALFDSRRVWSNANRDGRAILQLLYRKARRNTPVFLVTFEDDSPIVLHQLVVGEYEIYLSYVGPGELEVPRTKFSVWPAEVTYVGTFVASVEYPEYGPSGSRVLTLIYDRDSAAEALRHQFLDVSSTHRIYSETVTWRVSD